MADNNVFILFEEIKTALKGISGKLEELTNEVNQQSKTGEDNQLNFSPIKDVIVETAKVQSEDIKGLLAKQWKAYAQLSTVILQQLDTIKKCRVNKACNKSRISIGIVLTSSQARSFLSLWVLAWYVFYLCGVILRNGSPKGSMPMMR